MLIYFVYYLQVRLQYNKKKKKKKIKEKIASQILCHFNIVNRKTYDIIVVEHK